MSMNNPSCLPTPTPPALLSPRPRTNNTKDKNDKMLIKVRTLTGKEIELDIEPDYRVSSTRESRR
jgi:hypothetical protein